MRSGHLEPFLAAILESFTVAPINRSGILSGSLASAGLPSAPPAPPAFPRYDLGRSCGGVVKGFTGIPRPSVLRWGPTWHCDEGKIQ